MDLIRSSRPRRFAIYFMSQCPFGGDGEFSFERFADVYNSGLANNLGNLYSRILTMCVKYFEGRLGSTEGDRSYRLAKRARLRRVRRRAARVDRLVRLQRRVAADLAGGRRSGQSIHAGNRSRSSWSRPIWKPAGRAAEPRGMAAGGGDLDQALLAPHGGDFLWRVRLRCRKSWDRVSYSDAALP